MIRNAFTMIELVFVIVIIGILAAVGIPKLAIVRNDAQASVIATRLGNCIVLSGKSYLVTQVFDLTSRDCVEVTTTNSCFILSSNDVNGTLNIKNVPNPDEKCKYAQKITTKNLLSSDSGLLHQF